MNNQRQPKEFPKRSASEIAEEIKNNPNKITERIGETISKRNIF